MPNAVNEALLLQRIDQLESIVSSLGGSGTTSTRAGGKPPKPTNVVTVTQPGVIRFEWDPTPISDLLHYRVQISEDEGMTDAFEATSIDPGYTYYRGVAGTVYFARVSTVNRSNRGSDFTTPVSSAVGTVSGALTATVPAFTFIQNSGFASLVDDGATGTYGPLVVEVENDESQLVFVGVSLDVTVDAHFGAGGFTNGVLIEWLKRFEGGADSVIYSRSEDYKYENPDQGASTARTTLPFSPPSDIASVSGTYEYRVRLTVTSNNASNDLTILPVSLRFTALVFQ